MRRLPKMTTLWEREIVDNIFFEVDGVDFLYIQTKLRQQGKPYYTKRRQNY